MENSSSPETECNNGVSSTSPGEMTSVRTCYCKHEETAVRKKDNDVAIHSGNRHPTTIVSKKSMVTNRIYRNDREPCRRARRVTEKTLNTNRSVEVQPSNPVLSPETSTVLENAEKIINNAKIQLMEVCATSSFDSTQRNRNTYSDEPPLDDELEERLYVRELVASKFRDTRSSGTSGKASARSEKRDFPRVSTVRRIDLSAPKFRVSRRRRADWSSLGYDLGGDDRTRGRASSARVPSANSIGVVRDGTTARDRRRRASSARGQTCRIQVGPSVHIADRELTRQDLEGVHISPGSSDRARSRANAATYTLRHDVIRNVSDPAGPSGTSRRGKPIGRLIIEATTEAVPAEASPAAESERGLETVGSPDPAGRDDGRIESPRIRNGGERDDGEPEPRDAEGASECPRGTSRGAPGFAAIETPRADRDEKSKGETRNEGAPEGTVFGDNAGTRCAEGGEVICERSDADPDRPRDDENVVDEIRAEGGQDDRPKPSLVGDVSRGTGFPRREDIASRRREAEGPRRTIDGHFSRTFGGHNGRDGARDVVSETAHRRSFAPSCSDVPGEDNLDEVDLYRPRLDDLDSILHSNSRRIERAARAARGLSELLSSPEFATRRPAEDGPRDYARRLGRGASARSSILETELGSEDPTVPVRRTDEDPRGASDATGTKSSAFARGGLGPRGDRSKSSVESSVFPASGASDERSAVEARSESSTDGSDATTFSDLVPALSSTRADTRTRRPRGEEIARGEFPERGIRRDSGVGHADVFARLCRKGDACRAADRFVAYVLRDEERSVEAKIAGALRESAVAPATVRRLLEHLREAESSRDARQTETLDILRDILLNVGGQPDRAGANDGKTSSRNVIPDSSARIRASPIAIDGSASRGGEPRAEADGGQVGRVARGSGEPESPSGRFSEARESARSTARCESTRYSGDDGGRDATRTESSDVAGAVPTDAANRTGGGLQIDESDPTGLPRSVAASLIRTSAMEEAVLRTRMKNDTSGPIADKSKDSRDPDKHFAGPPAFPEAGGGSGSNGGGNGKGNSCSEAESSRQIPDIHGDGDGSAGENSQRSSAKIAISARSRGERETKADSITAVPVSEDREDDSVNNGRLEENKSSEAQQRASKVVTRTGRQVIAPGPHPEGEAAKETEGEKARDVIASSADRKALFAFSEVSERDEQASSDASAESRFIDGSPTKADVDLVRSTPKEDAGSSREAEIGPRDVATKERLDSARDRIAPSVRGDGSRNKVSLDTAEEDNSRNKGVCESTTLAAVESRGGNEISALRRTARGDNERRSIDSTERPRNCRTDISSSSNSSVSAALLDHDDRSTNGTSSANASRRVGTTPETSHSEGELYMPSSCSYSLGEVRVLRRKRESDTLDRDSSVTVLVTRSMLTSLNDSTVSLLESSGRV